MKSLAYFCTGAAFLLASPVLTASGHVASGLDQQFEMHASEQLLQHRKVVMVMPPVGSAAEIDTVSTSLSTTSR